MAQLPEQSTPARKDRPQHPGYGEDVLPVRDWRKDVFIARLIAEFHGGRIAAANRDDGGGVIVTLRFPLRAAAYNTGQPV